MADLVILSTEGLLNKVSVYAMKGQWYGLNVIGHL